MYMQIKEDVMDNKDLHMCALSLYNKCRSFSIHIILTPLYAANTSLLVVQCMHKNVHMFIHVYTEALAYEA